jgi:hypothetical protein
MTLAPILASLLSAIRAFVNPREDRSNDEPHGDCPHTPWLTWRPHYDPDDEWRSDSPNYDCSTRYETRS